MVKQLACPCSSCRRGFGGCEFDGLFDEDYRRVNLLPNEVPVMEDDDDSDDDGFEEYDKTMSDLDMALEIGMVVAVEDHDSDKSGYMLLKITNLTYEVVDANFECEMVVDDECNKLEFTVGDMLVVGHLLAISSPRHQTFELLDDISLVPATDLWDTCPSIHFPKSAIVLYPVSVIEVEKGTRGWVDNKRLFKLGQHVHREITSALTASRPENDFVY